MNKLIGKSTLFLRRNASTILTCLGAGGVVMTAVSAAKATPKALSLICRAEIEKEDSLTKWETVKTAAPAYIPSVMIGASTIACIFGANILNKRSQAALTSAYALLDNSYKRYIESTKHIYGEESHKRIINEIYEDEREMKHIETPSMTDKKQFFDFFSLQIFESTLENVQAAEQYVNDALQTIGYVSLAEFYDQLGIPYTDTDCALGWSRAAGCEKFEVSVELSTVGSDEEHYILIMQTEPTPNYMY